MLSLPEMCADTRCLLQRTRKPHTPFDGLSSDSDVSFYEQVESSEDDDEQQQHHRQQQQQQQQQSRTERQPRIHASLKAQSIKRPVSSPTPTDSTAVSQAEGEGADTTLIDHIAEKEAGAELQDIDAEVHELRLRRTQTAHPLFHGEVFYKSPSYCFRFSAPASPDAFSGLGIIGHGERALDAPLLAATALPRDRCSTQGDSARDDSAAIVSSAEEAWKPALNAGIDFLLELSSGERAPRALGDLQAISPILLEALQRRSELVAEASTAFTSSLKTMLAHVGDGNFALPSQEQQQVDAAASAVCPGIYGHFASASQGSQLAEADKRVIAYIGRSGCVAARAAQHETAQLAASSGISIWGASIQDWHSIHAKFAQLESHRSILLVRAPADRLPIWEALIVAVTGSFGHGGWHQLRAQVAPDLAHATRHLAPTNQLPASEARNFTSLESRPVAAMCASTATVLSQRSIELRKRVASINDPTLKAATKAVLDVARSIEYCFLRVVYTTFGFVPFNVKKDLTGIRVPISWLIQAMSPSSQPVDLTDQETTAQLSPSSIVVNDLISQLLGDQLLPASPSFSPPWLDRESRSTEADEGLAAAVIDMNRLVDLAGSGGKVVLRLHPLLSGGHTFRSFGQLPQYHELGVGYSCASPRGGTASSQELAQKQFSGEAPAIWRLVGARLLEMAPAEVRAKGQRRAADLAHEQLELSKHGVSAASISWLTTGSRGRFLFRKKSTHRPQFAIRNLRFTVTSPIPQSLLGGVFAHIRVRRDDLSLGNNFLDPADRKHFAQVSLQCSDADGVWHPFAFFSSGKLGPEPRKLLLEWKQAIQEMEKANASLSLESVPSTEVSASESKPLMAPLPLPATPAAHATTRPQDVPPHGSRPAPLANASKREESLFRVQPIRYLRVQPGGPEGKKAPTQPAFIKGTKTTGNLLFPIWLWPQLNLDKTIVGTRAYTFLVPGETRFRTSAHIYRQGSWREIYGPSSGRLIPAKLWAAVVEVVLEDKVVDGDRELPPHTVHISKAVEHVLQNLTHGPLTMKWPLSAPLPHLTIQIARGELPARPKFSVALLKLMNLTTRAEVMVKGKRPHVDWMLVPAPDHSLAQLWVKRNGVWYRLLGGKKREPIDERLGKLNDRLLKEAEGNGGHSQNEAKAPKAGSSRQTLADSAPSRPHPPSSHQRALVPTIGTAKGGGASTGQSSKAQPVPKKTTVSQVVGKGKGRAVSDDEQDEAAAVAATAPAAATATAKDDEVDSDSYDDQDYDYDYEIMSDDDDDEFVP